MRLLTAASLGLLLTATAQAASHRTFVAASGTDSGACGPTAPCRTLSYALGQTNSEGEIVITQSGGYGDSNGGLVINKSVSIIAEPGVFAALAPTSIGIDIGTPGVNVSIKGLNINGRGAWTGIYLYAGSTLELDNVTISNMSTGTGLHITTAARVTIKNTTFKTMNTGIRTGNGANVFISGSRFSDIFSTGIWLVESAAPQDSMVTIAETTMRCTSTSGTYGFDNNPRFFSTGKIYLDRVTVTNCANAVINEPENPGAGNIVAISNSFVTGNGVGLSNSIGNIFQSAGNNHVANNATDSVGVITTGSILK